MTNTSTSRKPTQRDYFNRLLTIPAVAEDAELVEFINGRIAQLDKKNSAERKPTAKQVENLEFRQNILDWMEPDVLYSSADITKGVPALVEHGLSPQRVSALLTQLVGVGAVTKTTEKRKNFYSLASL